MKISVAIVDERIRGGRFRVELLTLEKSGKHFVFPTNYLFPLFQVEKGRAVVITDERQLKGPDVIALVLC